MALNLKISFDARLEQIPAALPTGRNAFLVGKTIFDSFFFDSQAFIFD